LGTKLQKAFVVDYQEIPNKFDLSIQSLLRSGVQRRKNYENPKAILKNMKGVGK